MTFKVKKEDPINKLLRIAKYRFIKNEELSPHLLDPKGDLVYYALSCIELYFGKEAREEVERKLRPKQRVRILRVLQELSLESRLELVVPSYRKKKVSPSNNGHSEVGEVDFEENEIEGGEEDVEDFEIPI